MDISYNLLTQRKRWLISLFVFFIMFLGISNIANAQTLVTWDFTNNNQRGWVQTGTNSSWSYTNAGGANDYWGNNGTGNYNNNENAWIYSPTTLFGSYGTATLVFNAECDRTGSDYGTVDISTNGGSTWIELRRYTSDLASSTVNVALTPISDYNNKNIIIRFRLGSDGGGNANGWRVNWVRIDYTPPTGTVSGHIQQNSTGANSVGVTVTVRNSSSTVIGTQATDASGNYSLTVPVGTGHTVTPTLTGHTFTNASETVNVTDGGTVTANFTQNGNLLTGNVKRNVLNTNVSGVTISVNTTPTASVQTDANGNYSIFLPIGIFTVTPTLSGNSFSPANFTNVAISNPSGAVRDFTVNGGVISGKVTGPTGDLAGVTLTATGGYTTTSAADGTYSLFVPTGTSTTVTLTPSSGSYIFSPSSSSVTVTNGSTSSPFDFYGSNCGRIYGTVTIGGVAAAYFPVHLTGYQTRTTLTDASGNYEFLNLPRPNACGGGSVTYVNYVVTIQPHVVASIGEEYNLYQNIQLSETDYNRQVNFNPNSLSGSTFNLSGNVRAIIGSALVNQDGVTVTLERNEHTASTWSAVTGSPITTDATGNFSFPNLIGRFQYRLTVSKAGYNYEPSDDPHRALDEGYIYYYDLPGPTNNQDFIGTPKTNRITGNVQAETSPGGALANKENVLVTLYNSPGPDLNWATLNDNIIFNTQLTNATGDYSFDAPVGGNYMTVASQPGYDFQPPTSPQWLNLTSNQTQNFSGTLIPYNLTGQVSNLLASAPHNHQAMIELFEVGNPTRIGYVYTGPGNENYNFGTTKIYVNKQYTVSVAPFAGYTFTPTSVSINNPVGNQEANFVAIRTNFTIKGRVNNVDYTGNPNLTGEKVKLVCPGSVENEVYVNGDGSEEYTFTVLAFGTYTVTPSMDGHNFVYKATTSPNHTYTNISASVTGEDYNASIKTLTISGRVVDDNGNGVSGVSMGINNTGNIPGYTTPIVTDATGNYSYTVNARQNYTVTPTKTGVTIVPADASFTDLKENKVQFFFTTVLKTWRVTGYVTKNTTAGPGVSGATVTIKRAGSPDTWAVTVSDATGKYEFIGVQGESYEVTGAKTGYTVTSTPTPVVVPALTADYTVPTAQNIVATPIRSSVIGTVSGLASGIDATVNLQVERTGPTWVTVATLTTNNTFIFNSAVEVDSNYRVIASATGYTIYPPDGRIYSNPVENITNANFNVATDVQTITGTITGVNASHMPVTVNCVVRSGGTGLVITPAVVTDASGNYTITVSANGNYRVTPSRLGYNFTDAYEDVDIVTTSASNVNFVGTLRTHTITGTVTNFIASHGPAVVAMTNQTAGGTSYFNVNTSGALYSFTINELDYYTISAGVSGYSISPVERNFINVTSNLTGQDFVANILRYTISGTVTTSGGTPMQGVVVSCTGQTNQLTDALGNYAFTVTPFSDYTVTPFKPGYTFAPLSSTILNLTNHADRDFVGTANSYTISGTIFDYNGTAPLAGATVSCFNGLNTRSLITTATGTYTFTVYSDSVYTITPTKTGQTFNPGNRSHVNPSGNLTGQNFRAEQTTYTVTGYVLEAVTLEPIANALITVAGVPSYTTTSDANGMYSFTAIAGQSYSVTVSKPGYTWTNSPVVTGAITQNTTITNLLGVPGNYTISGYVKDYDNVTNLADVTVTLDNGTNTRSIITAADGFYSFTVYPDSSYTVTPTKTGLVFNPNSRPYSNPAQSYSDQNFKAEQNAVTMTGYVYVNGTATGLQNVIVNIAGSPSATTVTDANGRYTFTALIGQTYSITGEKSGWTITPDPLSSGEITASGTVGDLTATPNSFTVSGTVYDYDNSTPLSGVTVSLNNGTHTRSLITTGSGTYSFTVRVDSNYIVTPTKSGLVFNPDNRTFQNPSSSYSGQNFKAEQNAVTIQGRVVRIGTTTGLGDVVVTVTGNPNATTATDANGYYTFTALVGQSYSIAAVKAGWSITNISSVTITGSTTSVTDLIATPQTYTISGTIFDFNGTTPLTGVNVACNNGSNTRNLVTDALGTYSFSVRADSIYTITPTKTGLIFNPSNRNYQYPSSSYTNQNFKAEQNAVTVTGYVYINGTTTGLRDVVINVTGNPNATTATDANGRYTFTGLVGQTYSITGTKAGWTITPTPLSSGSIPGSTTIGNLTATPNSFTVSGTVFNYDGTTPLSGVTVTCNNGTNNRNLVTDATGAYSFTVRVDSNYTITPARTGYVFNPTDRTFPNPAGSFSAQNFKAEQNTYTITGYVTLNTVGLPGVSITVTGTPATTTSTDGTGRYTFTAFVGNSYSVTASKAGYSITSSSGNPQNTGAVYSSRTITEFTATTLTDAAIQGKVYSSGSLLDGATVRLYKNGSLASTQTTAFPAAYGAYSYSFTGLETNQDYKIEVEKAGFTFIPNEDGTGSFGTKYFNDLIVQVEQDFASNVNTKTLSGNVHSSSANIANVTININSGTFNTSAVTGADGNFTTTVPSGVEYILSAREIPDMGYSFANDDTTSRTTRYTGVVADNVIGMDFLATVKDYTITVNIAGVDPGDTVNLPNLGAGAVNVIGNGQHVYTVAGLANYTITPVSTEWNFNPSTVTYNNLIGNKIITFTASGKKQYTISGTVTRHLDGVLNGVVLSISPGGQTVSTNASGEYAFIVDAGTSYTITPSTTTGTGVGYTFNTTTTQPIGPVTADVPNVNFVATPIGGLSISGTVYNSGSPLEAAIVTLKIDNVVTSTDTTVADGKYEFTGLLAHSKYEIIVQKLGFAFIPNGGSDDGYKLFDDMIVSQVQDFASNTSNAVLSGNISNIIPAGIPNVPVTITSSGFNTNAVTDANGNYSALVPVGLEYTITPIDNPDQGYHYQNTVNTSLNYRETGYLSGNLANQNFTGIVNNYTISGIVSGVPSGNTVMIRLYDNTTGTNVKVDSTTANSASSWVYTFTGVPGLRNYLIVPELTDYAFNPTNRTLLNLIGNKSDQNFTATKALGPILISPLNGAQGVELQPTFVWQPPSTGSTPTNYKIQVATSSDFTGAMEYSANVLTYNGFSLSPATTYFWRVQSQSLTGNNWSEVWSFTTNLSVPVLNTPVCGSTTSVNPTLTWYVVPLATRYDVELRKVGFAAVAYNNITATSLNVTGLVNFTTYEWRVRAENDGATSDWSAWCAFTTDASIPALKSPISGAVGQPVNLTLEWYPVPGASTYTLEYSTNPNFTGGSTTIVDVNGTTKAITGLPINSTYFWRVKVKLPVPSAYSEVWYFSVGGAFSWTPANLDYGNVLVAKTASQNVTVTNNGATPIIIYVDVNGSEFNSPNKLENPITIPSGSNKVITVNFVPTSTGLKNGVLLIQHNVSSQPLNPVQIPLTGTGVSTFANLQLPALIDFGTVVFNSGSKDTTITVYNNSTIDGDYLNVSSASFETPTGIFTISTPFPIILAPGTSYPVNIRFNPNALGIQQNAFRVLNSSLNPDIRVQVRANVIQGDLVVTPAYVDFGNTTRAVPYKDTLVAIQNNSAQAITLTAKFLTGDTSSYSINNATQIVLQPNQTDYVMVRFFPRTAGRKTALFNINSNYPLAPALYVPLTGVGGEEPVLFVDMQTIDFGIMRKGDTKDTTVTLRNDGSLDLNITSKEFIGADKAMFSFVNDGQPIVLRGGESRTIILRATAMLPIGPKTAQLQLGSNDPNNGVFYINLLATVKSNSLFKSVERIVFDTVDVGYHADTTFILRNDGDLIASISKFELDGPYSTDFELMNITVPFDLAPNETKVVALRFAPKAVGLRFAQILITVNDPSDPNQRIIVQGYGRNVSSDPVIYVDGQPNGEPIIDFGRVPIFESRFKGIAVKNVAKYSKLRIDTMYIDSIAKQPFGYGNITFPVYVTPGELMQIVLSFNPKDKVRTYGAHLFIQYSDSTMPPNKNNLLKVRMTGAVIFPGMDFELTPVLKFGKVISGQSLKKEFVITNRGESYLIIDSMSITGLDAGEFKLNDKTPIRIEPDIEYTSSVTFNASKVGSKDAVITVYSNDLFKLGEIEIWAECIVSGGQTTGITKTDEIPTTYNLQQNYPNPFNPSTKIEYSVPEASHVSVRIFNSLGQEVAVLVDQMQPIGKYIIDWQPKNLPSGIYFYKMQSSKFSAIKKMVLLK